MGTTPFEVLYGHAPRHLGIPDPNNVSVSDLSSWLTHRNLLTKLIQQHLLRAQQRMKHQFDKNRSEREFQPGDMVYLKLQAHVQSSVAFRMNHNLSFWFYGPFKILARVGPIAYKLDLPATALIHSVVHVSQLKKHVPPHTEIMDQLDSVATDPLAPVFPIQVLEKASFWMGGALKTRVRVCWTDQPTSMAIWEDEQDMSRRYSTAWGQAVLQERGNVMI